MSQFWDILLVMPAPGPADGRHACLFGARVFTAGWLQGLQRVSPHG